MKTFSETGSPPARQRPVSMTATLGEKDVAELLSGKEYAMDISSITEGSEKETYIGQGSGVNDGTGISSIFSWAEWSSEHLRSGEMMLQHYCAKHFQTTWPASGPAARQRIVASLLASLAEGGDAVLGGSDLTSAGDEERA